MEEGLSPIANGSLLGFSWAWEKAGLFSIVLIVFVLVSVGSAPSSRPSGAGERGSVDRGE
jgi:hypothetical protein